MMTACEQQKQSSWPCPSWDRCWCRRPSPTVWSAAPGEVDCRSTMQRLMSTRSATVHDNSIAVTTRRTTAERKRRMRTLQHITLGLEDEGNSGSLPIASRTTMSAIAHFVPDCLANASMKRSGPFCRLRTRTLHGCRGLIQSFADRSMAHLLSGESSGTSCVKPPAGSEARVADPDVRSDRPTPAGVPTHRDGIQSLDRSNR